MEKKKSGMQDNRMVKDDHQRGIERVKGAAEGCALGKHGKMMQKGKANFSNRSSGTPRAG